MQHTHDQEVKRETMQERVGTPLAATLLLKHRLWYVAKCALASEDAAAGTQGQLPRRSILWRHMRGGHFVGSVDMPALAVFSTPGRD